MLDQLLFVEHSAKWSLLFCTCVSPIGGKFLIQGWESVTQLILCKLT